MAVVTPSPGGRVPLTKSLIRDLGRVSEWCDLWGMKVNASKTKTVSLPVTHYPSPVTAINYWLNGVEGVWWPRCIGSDIWIQDDLWEASSLCFQSSFSKTWHLEEDTTLISNVLACASPPEDLNWVSYKILGAYFVVKYYIYCVISTI